MKNLFRRRKIKKDVSIEKKKIGQDIKFKVGGNDYSLENEYITEMPIKYYPDGLSRREYFAGLAMQGILAGAFKSNDGWIIEKAISTADLLVKTLDGTINEPKIKVVYTYENKNVTDFVSKRYFNETEMWKKENIISIEVL